MNYDMYNSEIKGLANNKRKDKEFSLDIELYLYKTFGLYSS